MPSSFIHVVAYDISFFFFFSCIKVYFYFFFPFIFISWRLITLHYCSGFCHTFISFFLKAEFKCFKSQNWSHFAIIIIQCFFRESYLGVQAGQSSSVSSQIYFPDFMPLLLLVLSMKSFSQEHLQHFFFALYKIFVFYWKIVDLQCCISFRCAAKWFIFICAYIYCFSCSFSL